MAKTIPIRHIGYLSLCSAKHYDNSIHRIDLGYSRYLQLGVRERFKNEEPYRVCKRCLAAVRANERDPWQKYRRSQSRGNRG